MGSKGRAPLHRCVEIVRDGVPIRVYAARINEPISLAPGESISVKWLPSSPVSLAVAKALIKQRLQTIAAWAGLEPPSGS